VDTGKYLKLLPHLHGTDGFFAAVFERKDSLKTPEAKSIAPEGNIHAPSGTSEKKTVEIKAEKVKIAKSKAESKAVSKAISKPAKK
jgi:16S rRNA (cytosine967-C5)-methyltransferase